MDCFNASMLQGSVNHAQPVCLQILMDGKRVETRMEMDAARNWYLVGTPYRGDLEYIRARI